MPPEVDTTTFCAPGVPSCNNTVILVALIKVTSASTPPMVTLLAPVKFVPLIVIVVPPAMDPVAGVMDVMDGGAVFA